MRFAICRMRLIDAEVLRPRPRPRHRGATTTAANKHRHQGDSKHGIRRGGGFLGEPFD